MHFVPSPICIPVPVSNQHLHVRVVLLNIHTTFVIQHGSKYDMMHEVRLSKYCTSSISHNYNRISYVRLIIYFFINQHYDFFIAQHCYYSTLSFLNIVIKTHTEHYTGSPMHFILTATLHIPTLFIN